MIDPWYPAWYLAQGLERFPMSDKGPGGLATPNKGPSMTVITGAMSMVAALYMI